MAIRPTSAVPRLSGPSRCVAEFAKGRCGCSRSERATRPFPLLSYTEKTEDTGPRWGHFSQNRLALIGSKGHTRSYMTSSLPPIRSPPSGGRPRPSSNRTGRRETFRDFGTALQSATAQRAPCSFGSNRTDRLSKFASVAEPSTAIQHEPRNRSLVPKIHLHHIETQLFLHTSS